MAAELDGLVERFGPGRWTRGRPLRVDRRADPEGSRGRPDGQRALPDRDRRERGGCREILGIDVTSSSGAGWLAFLRGLSARGLSGVAMVTSDDHAGLVNAIAAVLPGRRGSAAGPTTIATCSPGCRNPPAVGVHPGPDHLRAARPGLGPRPARQVVEALEAQLRLSAAHLDEARDDILAFTAFPREVSRQCGATIPQERLNKEVRRRTNVVGIFPAATPSSAWSARSWPSRTTNGPNPAATWDWKYSPPAAKPAEPGMGKNGTSEAGLTIEAIPA